MSINIRYLTSGTRTAYVVFDKGVTPSSITFAETAEVVPSDIAHYVPEGPPKFVGPDSAHLIGISECNSLDVLDYFYPGHPNCTLTEYKDNRCVAESCKHAPDGDWLKCPHYPHTI